MDEKGIGGDEILPYPQLYDNLQYFPNDNFNLLQRHEISPFKGANNNYNNLDRQAITQILQPEHILMKRQRRFQMRKQRQFQMLQQTQIQHQQPNMEMQFQQQQWTHHVEQCENTNMNAVSWSQLPSMEVQFQHPHLVEQFENANMKEVTQSQLPSVEMQFQQRQHVEQCENANMNVISQAMESVRASLPETPRNGEKRKPGRPRKTSNHENMNVICQLMETTKTSLPPTPVNGEKRKPGRPRKTSNHANKNVVCQLMETAKTSLPPTPANGEKRKPGRPRKTGNNADDRAYKPPLGFTKTPQRLQFDYGEPALFRVIVIAAGEDVYQKIMSFYQQTPLTVCIISAKGTVSNVDFLEIESRRIINHKGEFEIISLSSSYTEDIYNLRVTLAHPDGKIFRGMVGGVLIAASSVEVVVGVFSSSPLYIPG